MTGGGRPRPSFRISHGSAVLPRPNLRCSAWGERRFVSSGRSPASNNSLCAYTPPGGVISIRGNWPLFPARDVVVPHTRTMPDMLRILDVLVQDDPITRGDFLAPPDVVEVPAAAVGAHRPTSGSPTRTRFQGRRQAVPAMYLGLDPDYPMAVRESVLAGGSGPGPG